MTAARPNSQGKRALESPREPRAAGGADAGPVGTHLALRSQETPNPVCSCSVQTLPSRTLSQSHRPPCFHSKSKGVSVDEVSAALCPLADLGTVFLVPREQEPEAASFLANYVPDFGPARRLCVEPVALVSPWHGGARCPGARVDAAGP